jgi:hypothetical protein
MESFKDKVPFIALGIATIAIAGYLCYKGKESEKPVGQKTIEIPEEIKKALTDFHWLCASLSDDEKEEAIGKWVVE